MLWLHVKTIVMDSRKFELSYAKKENKNNLAFGNFLVEYFNNVLSCCQEYEMNGMLLAISLSF